MDNNVKIAKELVKLAKMLNASDNTMTVKVIRTTAVTFDVEAENEEEAKDKVMDMYQNDEIDWEDEAEEDIDVEVF